MLTIELPTRTRDYVIAIRDMPREDALTLSYLATRLGSDMLGARAARLMSRAQLRRLPVTQNGHLTGMLSLADLARRGNFSMETAQCMESICSPVVHLD